MTGKGIFHPYFQVDRAAIGERHYPFSDCFFCYVSSGKVWDALHSLDDLFVWLPSIQ
jgi:hypothetical protein